METRVTEVAEGIHQLTTYVPEANLGFNQYLVTGDEPLLFHTGHRRMFPLVSAAVARVIGLHELRWVAFGHVEADECGSMNDWLGVAPQSMVVQSMTGCMVSLNDLADRAPRPLTNGEVLDTGGHRLRWIDTPHVPHGWEAGVLYDESTRTLLCGDLFTQTGEYAAASTDDVVEPAIAAEDLFSASSLAPASGATVRRLADLDVSTLALMHGPAFGGDCRAALLGLAEDYDRRVAAVPA
jgi:flavorubredoxin